MEFSYNFTPPPVPPLPLLDVARHPSMCPSSIITSRHEMRYQHVFEDSTLCQPRLIANSTNQRHTFTGPIQSQGGSSQLLNDYCNPGFNGHFFSPMALKDSRRQFSNEVQKGGIEGNTTYYSPLSAPHPYSSAPPMQHSSPLLLNTYWNNGANTTASAYSTMFNMPYPGPPHQDHSSNGSLRAMDPGAIAEARPPLRTDFGQLSLINGGRMVPENYVNHAQGPPNYNQTSWAPAYFLPRNNNTQGPEGCNLNSHIHPNSNSSHPHCGRSSATLLPTCFDSNTIPTVSEDRSKQLLNRAEHNKASDIEEHDFEDRDEDSDDESSSSVSDTAVINLNEVPQSKQSKSNFTCKSRKTKSETKAENAAFEELSNISDARKDLPVTSRAKSRKGRSETKSLQTINEPANLTGKRKRLSTGRNGNCKQVGKVEDDTAVAHRKRARHPRKKSHN